MLYDWGIVDWTINETSTWSTIVKHLLIVLLIVIATAWAGGDKASVKRYLIAITTASIILFGFHSFGQANIIRGSKSEILAKMQNSGNLYFDIEKIVTIKNNFFKPAIIVVTRIGNSREEKILVDTGGFGYGRIKFSLNQAKEHIPDLNTLYATETQKESNIRRSKIYFEKEVLFTPEYDSEVNKNYDTTGFKSLFVGIETNINFSKKPNLPKTIGGLVIETSF